MANVEILLSVLQTLFAALESFELKHKDLYPSNTYKNEFEKLQDTLTTIRSVLLDADSKQVEFELSEQTKLWIEELKDVVYDADDLVDEFVTLTKQKKRKHPESSLFEKLKSFFSSFTSLFSSFNSPVSKGIKEIREKLDRISRDHNAFGFKLDCQRIRKRRLETCSYVDEQEIKGEEGIEPILKLSYLNLDPQLKICASYCALFPKDYKIKKEQLIQLWIAQGYVVPLHDGQSIEDAAEEYFLTLLRRCFFQDIKRSSTGGEIESLKMHDLMHDIAQEAAGMEIPKYNSLSSSLDDKTRHLMHLDVGSGTKGLFKGTKIRTYLNVGRSRPESPEALDSLLDSWISLRALDLSCSNMRSLPSTIGKLLHLRYLDLSWNIKLKMLPNSITKLHNLQFLDVSFCENLKQLPKDLGKLTNLRVLNTQNCKSLTHMPTGIGKLSSIWKLPYFVVGEGTFGKQRGQLAHRVEELKALQNLKGSILISINIPPKGKYVMGNGGGKVCLSQHLTDIHIKFPPGEFGDVRTETFEAEEALLDDLQPHPNLREFKLEWYCGRRMPNWAMFFPKLVSIRLSRCSKLKHIGELRELRALKSLELEYLDDLEYIWNTRVSMSMTSSGARALESDPSFFPSLETVKLRRLPKLKGWWREESSSSQIDDDGLIYPSLPCLSKLDVENCPNFESMPPCPSVEVLHLKDYNLRLLENIQFGNSKLRRVETDNVGHLKLAMRKENFQCLSKLRIYLDDEVETLSEVEEIFRGCSSSLQVLEIILCSKLKSVRGGLEHLTALETLVLYNLPSWSVSKEGDGGKDIDDDAIPWCSIQHSLRRLELTNLPQMVKLPNGMRHLTALQYLQIWDCVNLEAIPEWMPELTSLERLTIFGTVLTPWRNDAARTPGKTGQTFNTFLAYMLKVGINQHQKGSIPIINTQKRNPIETTRS